MKVLITGGAGFIGSHSVEKLLGDGHQVTVLDNFSSGSMDNLKPHEELRIVEGEIQDRAVVESALDGIDAVLHLAAQVSVQASIRDPVNSNNQNVLGFLNVLDASFRSGVKRFIYASSAAVYGVPEYLPLDESAAVNPISPYGLEKSINDQYAALYNRLYGFSTLGLRYFNVYGTRQDASSPYAGVISKFVEAVNLGLPLKVNGDGRNSRDFIAVTDVAKVNAMAINGVGAGVCNVGTGVSVTLLELIDAIGEVCGRMPQIGFSPVIDGDIRHSSMSPSRLHQLFGHIAMKRLNHGLAELING